MRDVLHGAISYRFQRCHLHETTRARTARGSPDTSRHAVARKLGDTCVVLPKSLTFHLCSGKKDTHRSFIHQSRSARTNTGRTVCTHCRYRINLHNQHFTLSRIRIICATNSHSCYYFGSIIKTMTQPILIGNFWFEQSSVFIVFSLSTSRASSLSSHCPNKLTICIFLITNSNTLSRLVPDKDLI